MFRLETIVCERMALAAEILVGRDKHIWSTAMRRAMVGQTSWSEPRASAVAGWLRM
jgi:hypothetical protein